MATKNKQRKIIRYSFKLSIFLSRNFFFFWGRVLNIQEIIPCRLSVVHFSFLQNRSLSQLRIPLPWFHRRDTYTIFRTTTRKSTLLCMETDEPIAQCFQAKHWLVASTSARFWFDRNLNVHSNDGFMFETRALSFPLFLPLFARVLNFT